MQGRVYTPGAGHRPPVLAGRDDLRRDWELTCADVAASGRVASNDLVLVGPRGIGKTAALNTLADDAARLGFDTVRIQAVRGRQGLVASLLSIAERRIVEGSSAWARMRAAFASIAGVNASAFGVGGGISFQRRTIEPVGADAMTIAQTLAELADAIRRDHPSGGLMVSVDELQMAGDDLALLAGVLHRLNAEWPQARVLFAGTGLPNTRDEMVRAGVTHADRLFDMLPLSTQLAERDARLALVKPALDHGVTWDPDALDHVLAATGGYPSHLQSFAHATWQVAEADRITLEAAVEGVRRGAADFERRAMGPRWEEMSDRQREYLTAVAVLGGAARSAEVSALLGQTTQATSRVRAALLEHGDIYTQPGNRVALSVPLSADYALSRYEDSRAESDQRDALSPLTQMRARATERRRDTPPAVTRAGDGPSADTPR